MLVFNRGEGDTFLIGPTLVKVLKINGRVSLGVQAPGDVRILRGELATAGDLTDMGHDVDQCSCEVCAAVREHGRQRNA